MKSLLLSHKRNPEEKIEKIIDNKNPEEKKECDKEINKNENNDNINGLELDEDKEKEKEKKKDKDNEINNKKRIKKTIKKNKKKEEKKQENENKEKDDINNNKPKQPANKRIADYFSLSGKKEQNKVNSEENKDLNNNESNINKSEENNNNEISKIDPIKEINNNINKDEIFNLGNNSKIQYDPSYINEVQNIPEKIKSFYNISSTDISQENKVEYLTKLKDYFSEINNINNMKEYKKTKIIYIHNSFNPFKKIPTSTSTLINPKNYLAKDEYLIDYEKDSEDEYMEENAEDIKSNDNEDKEEDEEDDINSAQDDKFIVPDGHLSEEELSDKDIMKERMLLENSKEKLLGTMNILDIRKNFVKPILIDFRKKKNDDKVNTLMNKLTIGLFLYDDEYNNNENINNSNIIQDESNTNNIYIEPEKKNIQQQNKFNLSFPIVIGSKVTKYKGIEDSIKIHFEDILRKVHGSYDTKEHLILQLNKKFEDISKKTLNTFFKEKCFKIQKKYWMVNNDTLSQFNIKNDIIE